MPLLHRPDDGSHVNVEVMTEVTLRSSAGEGSSHVHGDVGGATEVSSSDFTSTGASVAQALKTEGNCQHSSAISPC